MIYALILNNKNENIATSIIFHKIIVYTDVFFKKNAEKLSEHEKGNYIIKLNEQDPSFESLYNLLSLKLKTFQEYLNNALAKRWIRHSISLAGAPVLFIFKRNSSLHLCVNY